MPGFSISVSFDRREKKEVERQMTCLGSIRGGWEKPEALWAERR